MPPKKAIITLFALTLLITGIFIFLFNQKQKSAKNEKNFSSIASDRQKHPGIKQKIETIIRDGEKTGKNKNEIRQNVIDALNDYVAAKNENMKQEEIDAKKDRDAKRREIINNLNLNIIKK